MWGSPQRGDPEQWPEGVLESEAQHFREVVRKVASENPTWPSEQVTAEVVRLAESDPVLKRVLDAMSQP